MGGRTCFEIPKLAESDEKRIRGLSVFLFPSFTLSSAMLVYDIPGVARAVVEGIAASDENATIVLFQDANRESTERAGWQCQTRLNTACAWRNQQWTRHDAPLHVPSTKKCTASSSCREAPPAKPALNTVVTNPKAPKPARV